ncbi:NAD(P)-dependent oxidoreductase [Arthrobacter sp. CDRTa11]|uniref:NAD-dependent epimerase/dehydratase family protein n=1 Tax=Arthrobacter sp. CDRTa11 TaxID=2651199 RepID=UPI002265C3AA|nr:NAD(P)-dependent oxidoreductase [Arthrobacter sp. CDRTa11]UZX04125.1 NAD(P)-dependent oxidoreductase [Arthrobacter sp. CDRTa11]
MRIAVTGATGFVGAAVAAAAEHRGWEVYRYGRRQLPGFTVWDLAEGNLWSPPEVDAVVHAGAQVGDWGPPQLFHRVNVLGTEAVAASFPRARLVHISSSSVYPWWQPCIDRPEQAPAGRYLNAYSRSKALAEAVASKHPNALILRPHGVYGPGDRTLLPRLIRNVKRGRLLCVGSPNVRHQLTSIGNLTEAALAACASDATGPVNVADHQPVKLGEVLREVLDETGRSGVELQFIPLRTAMTLAASLEALGSVTRKPPALTRYAVSQLGFERTYSTRRLREEVGVEPVPSSFSGAGEWIRALGSTHPAQETNH